MAAIAMHVVVTGAAIVIYRSDAAVRRAVNGSELVPDPRIEIEAAAAADARLVSAGLVLHRIRRNYMDVATAQFPDSRVSPGVWRYSMRM